MNLFEFDLYPTSDEVIDLMGIDCAGKVCLEPSAGNGNIVDYLLSHGASRVLTAEIHPQLRDILRRKSRLIGEDFLQVKAEDVSHVELIVMNPPFSADEKHILHAWTIAPEGCEIVALCNWNTVQYPSGHRGRELKRTIEMYGSFQSLGSCFGNADRKTDVVIGLVRLFRPVVSAETDFEGFFCDEEEEVQANGIMRYSEVRAIVNNYVDALRCYREFLPLCARMNASAGAIGTHDVFKVEVGSRNETIHTSEEFAVKLQKRAWAHVFDKLNLEKYVTSGVMKDINKFIETRKSFPFTMRNIYRMMEIIVGTSDETMNRAIVEAVDAFTKNTHENRFGVEGWKTNAGHLLNKKFIVSGLVDKSISSGRLQIDKYQNYSFTKILDITKALCMVTGTQFDTIPDIDSFQWRQEGRSIFIGLTPNQWYTWGFFEFKVFLKGSGHFKFRDEKAWELLNRRYAKIKGQVLPEGRLG